MVESRDQVKSMSTIPKNAIYFLGNLLLSRIGFYNPQQIASKPARLNYSSAKCVDCLQQNRPGKLSQ